MNPLELILGYLDPELGSLIVQALIGAFLAGAYFMRRTVGAAFRAVGRLFGGKKADEEGRGEEKK